jgi:hypothetical protein
MSGRRVHYRFGDVNAEGTLRVLRDVTVRRGGTDELVATSSEPAARGELFTLEPAGAGTAAAIAVCVVDSRPAMVGGRIRHRLRLKAVDAELADHEQPLATRATSRRR